MFKYFISDINSFPYTLKKYEIFNKFRGLAEFGETNQILLNS